MDVTYTAEYSLSARVFIYLFILWEIHMTSGCGAVISNAPTE